MKLNLKHKRRLYTLFFIILGVSCAVLLVLYALKQNINLYFTPEQLSESNARQMAQQRVIRIGGMVRKGSVQRDSQSLSVSFDLTDYKKIIPVQYTGILPTLFREGQGVVVQGKMSAQGLFMANEVLAKHDENYMPPGIKNSR
jgi:cytochrome c-type biogenesis protein CcmE